MKKTILLSLLFCGFAHAQTASVDISLTPAGSFKVKSSEVKGMAQKKGGDVEAKNIVVNLKNIETGIALRNTHTKKHLEVEKFPEAVLVSAKGHDGKGQGVVKIRGIEKEVKGTYKIEGSTLVASFPIKLSDFKINDIKYMGVGVEDEATVNVSVPLQ